MRTARIVLSIAVFAALTVTGLSLSSCSREETGPIERRVMIIGVDGLEWDVMGPLIEAGKLPTFARLLNEGAWGEIQSLDILESPVIWTSIATGKSYEKHGITGFAKVRHGASEPTPMTSNVRRVEAIWNILGERGLSVGVIGWLATWPAEPVNGYMVSSYFNYGWSDSRGEKNRRITFPEGLADDLAEYRVSSGDISEEQVHEFLAADVGSGDLEGSLTARVEALRGAIATDETARRVGHSLARSFPTDLFAVYFRGVDGPSHKFWTDAFPGTGPPLTEEEEKLFGQVVLRYYEYMDRVVGEFLEYADENTTVVVTSDHGHSGPKLRGETYHWGIAMHDPSGVVVLWGRDVVPGQLSDPSVLDITPTILALYGLPVADDMDGRVLAEAIDPAFLRAHPIMTVATYETSGSTSGSQDQEPVESPVDDEVRERLRSLGYIE
ncbi:alkaline phosphatase family protein [bacterium]|nr:alkaline phosphatase family protein [bacterium]